MSPEELAGLAARIASLALDAPAHVAGACLLAWFASEAALHLSRHRDPRAAWIARTCGAAPDHVIPLPPTVALWRDRVALDPAAEPLDAFPPSAPSLQASYLVHHAGGMAVLSVHSFAEVDTYHGAHDRELKDHVGCVLDGAGALSQRRVPCDPEQDAALRAALVADLLKRRFGYPGQVRAATLVKDPDGIAPAPVPVRSDTPVPRIAMADRARLARWISEAEDTLKARNLDRISAWFRGYGRRQTSRSRLVVRALALALCAGVIAAGDIEALLDGALR